MRNTFLLRLVDILFTTFVVSFSRPGSQQKIELTDVRHQHAARAGSLDKEVAKMMQNEAAEVVSRVEEEEDGLVAECLLGS